MNREVRLRRLEQSAVERTEQLHNWQLNDHQFINEEIIDGLVLDQIKAWLDGFPRNEFLPTLQTNDIRQEAEIFWQSFKAFMIDRVASGGEIRPGVPLTLPDVVAAELAEVNS
jgi:hypothetical protein